MKLSTFILFFSLTVAISCNSQSRITNTILSEKERFYCDSLKIDTAIVLGLRQYTDSNIKPFPVNLEKILNKDIDPGPNRKNAPGFIFNANSANSDSIVINLYNDFLNKGYTIFTLDRHSGIDNKPDYIGILKSIDKYQILKQIQTDGINWEINNDSLLSIIKRFDKKYSLQLIGASGDWCEFNIIKEPKNWLTLAKEAYKVCPDIVDQEAGTVEKLAEAMKESKRLYFWWD
jgi:hypothetical protein